jgi:hypothetical protein
MHTEFGKGKAAFGVWQLAEEKLIELDLKIKSKKRKKGDEEWLRAPYAE